MFASIANKRKIDEATSAKDSVAPVYLLEEIWQIIQSSGPETAAGFVDYTNRRLANRSPVVKQKALRLVKFICNKGSSEYKRKISKHAGTVRELQHYKGDPDPFKGDVPNQKVRDSAKEAMEAMFAPTDAPSYTTSTTAVFNSRIQGFGSSNASDGAGAASGTAKPASGMMGFGNPRGDYESPGDAPSRGEGFGGMIRVGSGALSPKAIMDSIAAKGNEFLQGRRGPGILNNDDQTGYSSDEADRGYEKPFVNGESAGSSLGPLRSENGGRTGGVDGREEYRLVDQVCTPGGMRAQPTREDLAIFVESAGGLNGARIAERLAMKMNSPSWQACLRALCALEAVIQHGHTAACGKAAVFFQADSSALEAAVGSPQASVRQRAARVLQLLGIAEGPSRPAHPAGSAPQASVSAPDLLGGLDDDRPPQSAAADPHADLLGGDVLGSAPQAAADAGGLLSGLDAPQPSSSTFHQADDLFQGLSTRTPQGTVPQTSSSNLFDELSAAPHQQSSPANALHDLLSSAVATPGPGPSVAAAGAVQRPADADLFGAPTATAGASAAADISDIFSGLSTNAAPASSGSHPQRQPSGQKFAAQRAASLEKSSDPLSSLGLPQAMHAPMGQGISAQRGSSATPTAFNPGMPGQQQGFPGMPQQLTPQQIQYLRQMQYMQYMQMQAMQARGMAGGFMPQPGGSVQPMPFAGPQQQLPFQQPGPGLRQPSLGSGSSSTLAGGPITLDALTGGSPAPALTSHRSSSLGISQQSDFDFVGEHVKTLRGKK